MVMLVSSLMLVHSMGAPPLNATPSAMTDGSGGFDGGVPSEGDSPPQSHVFGRFIHPNHLNRWVTDMYWLKSKKHLMTEGSSDEENDASPIHAGTCLVDADTCGVGSSHTEEDLLQIEISPYDESFSEGEQVVPL